MSCLFLFVCFLCVFLGGKGGGGVLLIFFSAIDALDLVGNTKKES